MDFEICQIVQQKAIKFVQRNFPNVQKNACALLVMGKVVHIEF